LQFKVFECRACATTGQHPRKGDNSDNAFLGHDWLTASEIYLNLSPEDALREL